MSFAGDVSRSIERIFGVLKKRTSDCERTLREFEMSRHGLKVGEPLTDPQGVLTGTPTVVGREGTTGRDGARP